MNTPAVIRPNQVTVVTVTYGDRQCFLNPVINALIHQGVGNVIIVNNGACWDVEALANATSSTAIKVLDMGANTGSAAGFSAGIAYAMEAGAELIWLLDDDNKPRDGALRSLSSWYSRLNMKHAVEHTAVLAFRPDHQADVAMGVSLDRINPRRSSFLGFHVLDIPYKLWRRTWWGAPRLKHGLPREVHLDVAPYSGLLFHRAVIDLIGLPRSDLILYADDTEFTYRFTQSGGQIHLITDALVEDLESSWNIKRRFSNSFNGVLLADGDFRAYYGMRNAVFFYTYCVPHSKCMYWINRKTYMALLYFFSVINWRRNRYNIILQAMQDGLSGRLGINEKFPLS